MTPFVTNRLNPYSAYLPGVNSSRGVKIRPTIGAFGYIGIVARSSQYPFLAADSSGNDLAWIDGNGNLYTKGTVNPSALGSTATSYARTMSPAIEDTGTAHLVHGAANVYLDPSFARSIDSRTGYQVFLTPGGDTRGPPNLAPPTRLQAPVAVPAPAHP